MKKTLTLLTLIFFLCSVFFVACKPENKGLTSAYNDYVNKCESEVKSYISYEKWERFLLNGKSSEADNVIYNSTNGDYTVKFINGETTTVNESVFESVPYETVDFTLYADYYLDYISLTPEIDCHDVKQVRCEGKTLSFEYDLDDEGIIIKDSYVTSFNKGEKHDAFIMVNDRAYPCSVIYADVVIGDAYTFIELLKTYGESAYDDDKVEEIKGKYYILSCDLDIEGEYLRDRYREIKDIDNIPEWHSVLDGNGYALINMGYSWYIHQGLFSVIAQDGTVKNLTVDTPYYPNEKIYGFKGNGAVIADVNYGLIENCCVKTKALYYSVNCAYLCTHNMEGGVIKNCLVIDTGTGKEDKDRPLSNLKYISQDNSGTIYHVFLVTSVRLQEGDCNVLGGVKNSEINDNGELIYVCEDIFEVLDHAKSDTLELIKDKSYCVLWGNHVIDE